MLIRYRRVVARALAAAAVVVMTSGGAFAQTQTPAAPRGFVAIGFGSQSATPAFSERDSFPLHAETGTVDVNYAGKGGGHFEVSGGARLVPQIFVGVAYSSTKHTHDADAMASLPHPFFFSTPRLVSGNQLGLRRSETAVHVPIMWRLRVAGRVEVMAFVGPSFLSASQDFIEEVRFSEAYPYDTAQFEGITVREESVRTMVPHFGVALAYNVVGNLGLGAQIRQASSTVDFDLGDDRKVRSKVGGTQLTFGLWYGF